MDAEAVLAFGILCATTATFLLAHVVNVLDRGARARRILLLRLHLHALAQAQLAAEHRDRRRRGRVSAAGGLGGRDRARRSRGVYLFLIIFYWTPPHFWALALNKQRDYSTRRRADGAARVGRARDDGNMLWYTLILLRSRCFPWRSARSASLPRLPRRCSAAPARRRDSRAARRRVRRSRRGRCTSTRCSISRCSSRRWSSTGRSRDGGRATRVTPAMESGQLAVHLLLGASANAPEMLLLLGRAVPRVVRVREWSGNEWSAPPPRECGAGGALLARLGACSAQRDADESVGRCACGCWLRGEALHPLT